MDGLFIDGTRPKTKKALREAFEAGKPVKRVSIESTSMFGGFSGDIASMPEHTPIYFVGPDPFRSRKFYGSIVRNGELFLVR